MMKINQLALATIPAICIIIPPVHLSVLNEYNPYLLEINSMLGSHSISPILDQLQQEAYTTDHNQIALVQQPITKAGGVFTVPAGLPFIYIWVHNQGSSTLTVQVKNVDSTTNYILQEIAAGQALVIPNQAKVASPGEYAIYFSGADGIVAGEFNVMMDSTIK